MVPPIYQAIYASVAINSFMPMGRPLLNVFSEGTGRTGAFCALVTSLERVKQDQSFNLFQTIMLQRIQRPKMVTTVVSTSIYIQYYCTP